MASEESALKVPMISTSSERLSFSESIFWSFVLKIMEKMTRFIFSDLLKLVGRKNDQNLSAALGSISRMVKKAEVPTLYL